MFAQRALPLSRQHVNELNKSKPKESLLSLKTLAERCQSNITVNDLF